MTDDNVATRFADIKSDLPHNVGASTLTPGEARAVILLRSFVVFDIFFRKFTKNMINVNNCFRISVFSNNVDQNCERSSEWQFPPRPPSREIDRETAVSC